MLKKLKLRFILISMLSVLVVLTFTIGAINIANKVEIESHAKNALTQIIEIGTKDEKPKPGEFEHGEKEKDEGINFRETHYFITVFDSDGNKIDFNYNHCFVLNDEQCLDLSNKVFNNELKGWKYDNFRFKKATKEDGLTYVAFVDIKLDLDYYNYFLMVSSLISVGAYAVLFGLVLIASKIAFKPSEEAFKKQKQFITNASHELKTPLTVISTDLDLVEMDNGKSEWTDSIRNQVERLTKMTKQLVDLSRLEEDATSSYPFLEFSLNEVFDNVITSFTPMFDKAGIKFTSRIDENLVMTANRHLIEELIYVFLDNSLKYTGGEDKQSNFVVTRNNKGKIEFKFSNTISKDDETDVKQIMERFYRSPSNKKEGSGIGLSIAQEIINLHKGKTKVDKSNNTLSFVITFN